MKNAFHILLTVGIAAVVCPQFACSQATPPLNAVDPIIDEAVQSHLIPGAVLIVGRDNQIIYRKAYGLKAWLPDREAMALDTIFDAASLTKVISTTPSIMRLFEQGKLRLDDPVIKYLPEFQGGKSEITIRLLMTHFSGLPPDVELVPVWSGYQTGIDKALTTKPIVPPGVRFIYSDINFVLLGEIVRRLSGQPLNEFVHDQIYAPLGMNETGYLPNPSLMSRIAPTEYEEEQGMPFRGVVHDPTARYMGGVAGHAGVFTTADDLAKYAQMLVNMGTLGSVHLLNPETVRKFTEPASPADQPVLRGLGWDIDSPFSSNRGELFPIGSYGHTGFTGTSLWIDPNSHSFVIFLSNVVHLKRGVSLSSLRSRLATAIAGSFGLNIPNDVAITGYNETIAGAGAHRVIARNADTQTGIDVLEAESFREFKGKRIGLITNQTGLNRAGKRNIDVMVGAGVRLTTLYSPEHGINGVEDNENVANAKDPATGIAVVSLYQPNQRRLTAAQMQNVDAVVFDIQDVGARFYTYSCTMLYALEEAGKARKPFYVLDRPNPITGTHIEAPMIDKDLQSFVGCYDMPLRHGLTFGELARMANSEQNWGADLHVIKMKNWLRGDWFDSSSLQWVNPSPNMRSLNAALLYPGIAMLEYNTNYSVGRGTDAPFEQIGADWIQGQALATALNAQLIPGVRAYPTKFQPTASNFSGQNIEGVRFVITDRESFDSTRLGIEIAVALRTLYPGKIDFDKCKTLIGSHSVINDLAQGKEAIDIWTPAQTEAIKFSERRKQYLLY